MISVALLPTWTGVLSPGLDRASVLDCGWGTGRSKREKGGGCNCRAELLGIRDHACGINQTKRVSWTWTCNVDIYTINTVIC